MEMAIRLLVIILFSASAFILFYAYKRFPLTSHLLGIFIWCIHVIIFTVMAIVSAMGILCVEPRYLNVWSNVVRVHGGIVMFTTGLYYVSRKDLIQ